MEIRVSPDFKIVSGQLSGLRTNLLSRIIDGSAQQVAQIVETRTKPEVPSRTGEGRDSLHAEVVQSSKGRSARIELRGLARLTFVKEGTKPHIIRPRSGRMLAWMGDDGTLVFARSVNHPGQQANNFIARGWEAAEPEVRRTLREAGLRGWRELARFK